MLSRRLRVRVLNQSNKTGKATGEIVPPERQSSELPSGSASTKLLQGSFTHDAGMEAAAVLVAHLFAQSDHNIPGVSYAVAYRLAEIYSGGDIVDVYQFDNDAVSLSIADISGKGAEAAVHAALIKYGLRAYSSHGLTPEKSMRALDRLYLENSTFENSESFATVFLGTVDPRRRTLTYSSAGHEPVVVLHPHLSPKVLPPTAPLIGVFEDQHHLFRQETLELWPGSLLLTTTDGVTEARNEYGECYGMRRLLECVTRYRDAEPSSIVDAVISDVQHFSRMPWRDDVAILAARFP
ncbi:MAG: PP2C family protein-serine/threonine phosphatase [Vulcanimicrobiaceae bacterium]